MNTDNKNSLNEIFSHLDFTEKGAVQFYISSDKEKLPTIIDEIKKELTISDDNFFDITYVANNHGGINSIINNLNKDKTTFIVLRGIEQCNIQLHGINQNINYLFQEKGIKAIILLHIDSSHENSNDIVISALKSQFKKNVIEILD